MPPRSKADLEALLKRQDRASLLALWIKVALVIGVPWAAYELGRAIWPPLAVWAAMPFLIPWHVAVLDWRIHKFCQAMFNLPPLPVRRENYPHLD